MCWGHFWLGPCDECARRNARHDAWVTRIPGVGIAADRAVSDDDCFGGCEWAVTEHCVQWRRMVGVKYPSRVEETVAVAVLASRDHVGQTALNDFRERDGIGSHQLLRVDAD